MQKLIDFKNKEVKCIRILQDSNKIAGKKDILKVGLLLAPEIYLMIKVAFF